ncbi:MAG: hypothetical protein RIT45_3064 [Pseudomonadota bacterium]|jgi:hypothetical protein
MFSIRQLGVVFSISVVLVAAMVAPVWAAPSGGEVLLLGSSSVFGAFGHRVERELEARGLDVTVHGRSSSGFARPDFFDWQAKARAIPIGRNTRAAIVYLGGNDAQGFRLRNDAERRRYKGRDRWLRWKHRNWARAYADRVAALGRLLCQRGLRRVVFVTPADVRDPWLRGRLTRIRKAITRGARRARCARVVSAAGDVAALAGDARRPRAKRLRGPDGAHMTRLGADRLWKRIGKRLVSALGVRPRKGRRPVRGHRTASL